jgi:hypothetical protein
MEIEAAPPFFIINLQILCMRLPLMGPYSWGWDDHIERAPTHDTLTVEYRIWTKSVEPRSGAQAEGRCSKTHTFIFCVWGGGMISLNPSKSQAQLLFSPSQYSPRGHAVVYVVEAPCYMLDCRRFDSDTGLLNSPNPFNGTMALRSTQPVKKN